VELINNPFTMKTQSDEVHLQNVFTGSHLGLGLVALRAPLGISDLALTLNHKPQTPQPGFEFRD